MKQFPTAKIGLFLLSILIFTTGCTSGQQTEQSSNGRIIKDRVGRTITVPQKIAKIISLAPAITQILVDLDLEDKLVAVDTNSIAVLPKSASSLPTIDILTPNIEQISLLQPDLILASTITTSGDISNDPLAGLEQLGATVSYIPTSNSIDDIKTDLLFIADIVNKKDSGQQLITAMETEIESIRNLATNNVPNKKVYFEIAAAPNIYSFGNGVFLNEMLQILGLTNIFSEQKEWFPVEEESVITANPDIIFTNVNYISDPVTEINNRPGWTEIQAIKDKKVYYIDNSSTSLPNNHITAALTEMAEYLYEK